MNDDQLHRLLREFPAQFRLPKSFVRSVWSRIEAAESRTLTAGLRSLGSAFFVWLSRPLPATFAIALFLAFGLGLGRWRYQVGHAADEMYYIRSISPLIQADIESGR